MFHGQWTYQNKMSILHLHFNTLLNTINAVNFAILSFTYINQFALVH
jgi:hypothetical protein